MDFLAGIAYLPILGRPLVMYLGILTFLFFLFTAAIAILNRRGIGFISFKWHPRFAITSLTLAFIHGLLAVARYFSSF